MVLLRLRDGSVLLPPLHPPPLLPAHPFFPPHRHPPLQPVADHRVLALHRRALNRQLGRTGHTLYRSIHLVAGAFQRGCYLRRTGVSFGDHVLLLRQVTQVRFSHDVDATA